MLDVAQTVAHLTLNHLPRFCLLAKILLVQAYKADREEPLTLAQQTRQADELFAQVSYGPCMQFVR